MNKTDFSKRIASRLSITQKEAQRFINVFEETLGEVIAEDGFMISQGFGTFSLWEQTERVGRNPKTGVTVTIPARNSVKFKPGKDLIDFLNKK